MKPSTHIPGQPSNAGHGHEPPRLPKLSSALALLLAVGRSPSPDLLGLPGITAGPHWYPSEEEEDKLPSERASTGLSRVLVPAMVPCYRPGNLQKLSYNL